MGGENPRDQRAAKRQAVGAREALAALGAQLAAAQGEVARLEKVVGALESELNVSQKTVLKLLWNPSPEDQRLLAARLGERVADEVEQILRGVADGRDGTWNLGNLVDYSHPAFVAEMYQLCGTSGSHNLQPLLDAVAARLQKRGDRPEPDKQPFLASVLAALVSFGNKRWRWPYACVFNLMVRAWTSSRQVCDAVAGLLPGCPTYDDMRNGLEKAVGLAQACEAAASAMCDIAIVMDNCQKGAHTSRSSIVTKWLCPVVTMVDQCSLMTVDAKTGEPAPADGCLQLDASLDPTGTEWKSFASAPREAYEASDDDRERLQAFLLELLLPMVELAVLNPLSTSSGGSPASTGGGNPEAGKKPGKYCTHCGLGKHRGEPIARNVQKCPSCRKPLPKAQEFDDATGPASFTAFVEKQKPKPKKQSGEPEPPAADGLATAAAHRDIIIERAPQEPIKVNPAGRANLRHVYDTIGKANGVAEFGETEAMRHWLYLIADECAIDHELLRKDKYRRLKPRVGTGHELMAFLRALRRWDFVTGGRALASICNYNSPAAEAQLFHVTANHKSEDHLLVQLPGYVRAATQIWLERDDGARALVAYWGELSREDRLKAVARLVEWVEGAAPGDPLGERGRFYFRGCAAYAMMSEATKKNKMDMYLAGRRCLQPLLWVAGSSRYGPMLLRDSANLEHCWPEKVREHCRRFFSCEGQGYDFKMEESIKAVKALCSCATWPQYLYATLMRTYVGWMTAVLAACQGFRPSAGGHTTPDYEADAAHVGGFLLDFFSDHSARAGASKAQDVQDGATGPGEPDFTSLEGNSVGAEFRFAALMAKGAEAIPAYATKHFKYFDALGATGGAQASVAKPVSPKAVLDPLKF